MATSLGNAARPVSVGRRYRSLGAWAGALALHVLVLGGIADWRIGENVSPRPAPSLDVVLATQPALDPGAAQALAEADQQATRREASEAEPEAQLPEPPAPPAANDASEADSAEAPPSSSQPAPPPVPQAPTSPATPESPPSPEPEPEPTREPPPAREAPEPSSPPQATSTPSGQALLAQATSSIRERAFEGATATDDSGDRDQQAAQRAAEARYIADWTRRVETYGNQFYPAPPELDGQLRIRVVIGRDGQVRQAEVLHSSGHPELDQAALETVHGAAPYRPFDRGMGDRDTVTITRVWRFGKGNNFGVH